MTNTTPPVPPHIAKWLAEQLKTIEKTGNDLLEAQVYTDADNIPTAAAGTGTISIAGFYLTAQHLEPAFALLDTTSTPMRLVEKSYLNAFRAAQEAASTDDDHGER